MRAAAAGRASTSPWARRAPRADETIAMGVVESWLACCGGVVLLAGLALSAEWLAGMGAPTTFAHAPVLTAPQLELAKTVDGLLPDQFSVCTTVTPDCPGGYQTGCGDLMLLGGDAALENGGCGALYIFWRQDPEPPHGGYLGFGVQCNGGDSETTLDSSPPHRLSSGKAYEVEYRYDRSTKAAEMLVDGVTQASATRAWNFPHDGSVTLMVRNVLFPQVLPMNKQARPQIA